ncbi:MAG: hypothetical protein JWM21_3381 [Acidobacteria bacterium]|nr:hypothetical protein [Acidobacteriota bacterium]
MATEQITLRIDADAARIFKSASTNDREKLELLLGVLVKEYTEGDVSSLKSTMDEIAAKARERGLTPEILEVVLKNQ